MVFYESRPFGVVLTENEVKMLQILVRNEGRDRFPVDEIDIPKSFIPGIAERLTTKRLDTILGLVDNNEVLGGISDLGVAVLATLSEHKTK